jgi:hypothetical protein
MKKNDVEISCINVALTQNLIRYIKLSAFRTALYPMIIYPDDISSSSCLEAFRVGENFMEILIITTTIIIIPL